MGRFALFAVSLLLVAAHLTGTMRDLSAWFEIDQRQLMYVIALPFAALAALMLLRDKA